ncbi:histone H1 [bacterium]|nr:histone H1 [bacterium]
MEKTVFEQFSEMEALWNEFAANHTAYVNKGNKAAAARARKAINSLKKMVTKYKQANVEHVKAA